MRTPYGLGPVESCAACAGRGERPFCGDDEQTLGELDANKFVTFYPRGALLFVEGEPPRGVYIVCAGRAKLTTSSGGARVLITHLAGPGEVLGLSAVLSGTPYEVTAETIEPSRVGFIGRESFLRFVAGDAGAALRAARHLGRNYRTAFEQVRLLGLSNSAAAKFARFLLEACERDGAAEGPGDQVKLSLTHEEIGQLIGASRETVTRLFSEFKTEALIHVSGATLRVRDRTALEALADG
ncbi:MAG TPA: Crp/Fnr family transcriptional regulator [Pyrinomonadaceae bacterium]|nr:Crp/Fnr family transcriptional regulator [Pyrinomonadaceae bacterium]